MKSRIYFVLLLLLSSSTLAQNLSGVWEGGSAMGQVKLVIIQQGDSCFGYIYESSFGSCTAHFVGRYDVTKKGVKRRKPRFYQEKFWTRP